MNRSVAGLVLVAALLAGCADESEPSPEAVTTDAPDEPGSTAPPGAPAFTPATILIDGAETGPVLLQGEVADTEEARAWGLMGRESLPDDYGMAFIFFEETDCCFHMLDTPTPLSIAFFDRDGKIVHLEDMDPCPTSETNCPTYGSDEPYIGALEVKQGLYERWGVEEGDRVRIVQ
jgi:uncharacterized membrane protein (UPF0127 family)